MKNNLREKLRSDYERPAGRRGGGGRGGRNKRDRETRVRFGRNRRSLSMQSRCDANYSTFQSDLQDSSSRGGGGDARIFTGCLEPAFFRIRDSLANRKRVRRASARFNPALRHLAHARTRVSCTLTRRARETAHARGMRDEGKKEKKGRRTPTCASDARGEMHEADFTCLGRSLNEQPSRVAYVIHAT